MEGCPSDLSDPSFDQIGCFFVRKDSDDIGVRQRTRLAELEARVNQRKIDTIAVPLVTSKSVVSLRVLAWTVTNYSKRHNVTIEYQDMRGNSRLFNIHHEYRAWLRVWRRRLFDPFARRSRIFFRSEGKWCATTVAQLNFIVFSHTLGIIDYVKMHVATIEKEMNSVLRNKPVAVQSGSKRRRTELSAAPLTRCSIFERPTCVVWKT